MSRMKTCFLMNYGPHYRFPIYSAIGEKFDVEFFFGDHLREKIKGINYNLLPSFGGILKNSFMGPFYWQHGVVGKLFNKQYCQYVMVGDVYCLSTWATLLLAKCIPNSKTCLWTHGLYGSETPFQRMVKSLLYKLCDRILVYNEYSIHNMERVGIPTEKMMCIANSLDSDKEKALRNKLVSTSVYTSHFGNDNPVIIYCGRIQKRKRLDLLIDAIHKLKEINMPSNLIIVGKDDDEVHLEYMVNTTGLNDYVWFYGPCYDDEKLAELFYNASVCVSPGNVGLTAIHSLTFGCPVVTHSDFTLQMPEFEAIKEGITGSFFERNNLESLVKSLIPWLSDGDNKRELSRKAAFHEIDRKWNVHYQLSVLENILTDKNESPNC